jgi:hypothetical protein
MRPLHHPTLRAWLGLVLASGCYTGVSANDGTIAEAGGSDDNASVGDDATESAGDSDGDPELEEVPPPTLRRLTVAEFGHSVQDLLGPVALAAIEPDWLSEGFFAVGNARIALSPSGVASYESALDLATAEAFADPARVQSIVACVPSSSTDVECMREAIAEFGRRAWRRPLRDAELDRYVAVATGIAAETSDGVVGLRHAIWGVLQSPYFLYRVEVGFPSEEHDGRLAFSSHEMASRLSFTLWSTVPDDDLLDAADRDELTSAAGVRAQAERMLADPRARQGVENFAAELYGLWALEEKEKDAELFPEWTPTLETSMRAEVLARVERVVFDEPGDFFSLYDGREVIVDNELARIYGVPEVTPDQTRRVTLPAGDARRGLIGSALVLAMNSLPARTSATKRGQFISETLLCRTVPPPDDNVDTNLDDDEDEDDGPRTLREKLESHRKDPACAGCHALTDPLGLALEHFDTVGRYRETDEGLTIDASGELDGEPFADAAELATVLRNHPDARACLVRKLYTYTAGRLPFDGEDELLAAVEADLAGDDNRFDRLLYAIVTHDDFRFAHPAGTVPVEGGEMP